MWPEPSQPWILVPPAGAPLDASAAVRALQAVGGAGELDPDQVVVALSEVLRGEGVVAWTPVHAGPASALGGRFVFVRVRGAGGTGLVVHVDRGAGGYVAGLAGYQPTEAGASGPAGGGDATATVPAVPVPERWDEPGWRTFLAAFSAAMIARPERLGAAIAPDVAASGWLGHAPASDEQLAAAERRLGRSLPPSLRAFYRVTNGWRNAGWAVDELLPVERIDWVKDARPDLVELCGEGTADEIRLLRSLAISPEHDSGNWFLDPDVRPDGEWPALELQPDWFGIEVFPSFPALMVEAFRFLLEEG